MSAPTPKDLAKKAKADARQRAERKRNLALNAMILSGLAIIITFGFCSARFDAWKLNAFFHHLGFTVEHHWKSWELGALLWTFIFVFYYFLTVSFDVQKHKVMVRLSLLCLGISTLVAAASLLYLNRPLLHVLSVTLVGATLMLTDGLLARGLRPGKEQKEYRDSFWIAGVPTVFAYLVLVVYLVSVSLYQGQVQKDENPEIFMSGAISFQLLASNIVFVILQKGWLRHTPKRMGKRPRISKTKTQVPT